MSLLDAPARAPAWFPITTNCNKPTSRLAAAQTSRTELKTPVDVSAVRVLFAGWYVGGTGETPNTNPILVRAVLQPKGTTLAEVAGDAGYRFTFGGRDTGVIPRGSLLASDPLPVALLAGSVWFVKSFGSPAMPAAPSAPSVAASGAGGVLATGTYGVCITIAYPHGIESAASSAASIAVTLGQNVVVTAPTAVAGAIGYRVWITYVAGSQVGTHYDSGSGIVAFGTNYSIITGLAGSAAQGIEGVDPTGALYVVGGGDVNGSTGTGGSSNGEGWIAVSDYTGEGRATVHRAAGSVFAPVGVLGYREQGRTRSVALVGDSICAGTADAGFTGASRGGFQMRTAMGQRTQVAYDPTVYPTVGHLWLGCASETALQFSVNTGFKRSLAAFYASTVWSNYGTNDLGLGSAPLAGSIYTIGKRFTDQKKRYIQSDLIAKATSTDGWVTLANQLTVSAVSEASRRAFNNWVASATGAVAVSGEAPFRGHSGTKGPSYDFYGGGDGSITTFYTAHPFVQGSQAVTVAGVAKALTTDYTYALAATVNGVAYASGITFLSAPANGAAVLISYTKMPGMASLLGSLAYYMPIAAAVSVDGGGVADKNGAFWKLSDAPLLGPRALTAVSTITLTDGAQSWTTDQWRGYGAMIVTDSGTPAAVGQVRCIGYNTATVLTFGQTWTTTPSVSATYQILKSYTQDGTHPTSFGHLALAQAADLTLIV